MVNFHRAAPEHVQPIRLPGDAAENHSVFLGIELRELTRAAIITMAAS